MKYIFVTQEGGEGFETHKEAFDVYENHTEEFRGVFKITSTGAKGINVSGNVFNYEESYYLKEMAKKVAKRHRSAR